VDVLVAHIVSEQLRLSVDEYADLERLLNTYELPLAGFVFLNDRKHILEQLRPR
jgi:hypothetical protein